MKKKYTIFILGLFIVLIVISLIFFKNPLGQFYYSVKYEAELNILNKYLSILSEGQEDQIRIISTTDAYFLRSTMMPILSNKLKQIDISSLRVDSVVEKIESGTPTLFIIVFFYNNPDMTLNSKLINISGKWLLNSVTVSDSLKSVNEQK